MPLYSYICPNCGFEVEDFHAMADWVPDLSCWECNSILRRNYKADLPNPGHKDCREIVSHSLAMHPDQIPEHNKLFPNIKVTDDGCPVFTHTGEHDKYLKAIGWKKNPGKVKRQSKKLPCGSGNHE